MIPIPAFFEFECPVKTHCGHRALDHMPFELRAMDVAKPLLIGDVPASHAKRWRPVVNAFRDSQMTIGVVEEIPTDDPQAIVRQLAAIYRDKDCDAIVAVGQGPFIDMAKWLNLVVSTGEETLDAITSGQAIPRTIKPLAVIPSAAADGYEVSGLLRTGNEAVASVNLMPQLIFIDPRSVGQPDDIAMAETALMALTHGVETFFRSDANPMTAVYARTATRLALDALHQLSGIGERGSDLAWTVAQAAALGGCALGCGPCSTTHAIGQAIAAGGKISAAQAAGVVLSYALEHRAIANNLDNDALWGLLCDGDHYARTPDSQRGSAAFYFLRSLLNDLFDRTDGQIRRTLQDAGLTREELQDVTVLPDPLAEEGDTGDYATIMAHAWDGRPLR
ncbi:MAG: iron-containing alcohol dehydrogenase [Desulfobacteraceae bacterium]|nr:iron-containing alcohol dehydrogenase [Desulfobacteraceae bacterium]MBC2752684.1 iron-containing alcohol dehydrogenase [Desulfobacteraceae bacterium]